MGRKLWIGGGVALLLSIVVCCGGGWAVYNFAPDQGLSAATFEAVTVGAPEDQVRRNLPDEHKMPAIFVYAAEDTSRSGMPKNATCDHYLIKDNTEQVYRFCFTGGKVVEKKVIAMPR
jgi:hypothetical protein